MSLTWNNIINKYICVMCSNIIPFAFSLCVCVNVVSFSSQGPRKALCQCSCRHLNRHETHFQWDSNHFFLSQQRAVLQCQPYSAISTGIRFLAQHWQAFRISRGHSRPWEAQQASNKWSSGQHRLSYCEGLWQLNHKKVSDRSWGLITNRIKGTVSLVINAAPQFVPMFSITYYCIKKAGHRP